MDISGQWQFQSLYLCKTKPKCIGCRKQLDEQTFSHLPYLSDTLAKTDLFGKDIGQQTTDNGLLGGSRLFLRLRVNKTTSKVVAVLTFDFRLLSDEAVPQFCNSGSWLKVKKLVVSCTCSLRKSVVKKNFRLWSFVLRLQTQKKSSLTQFQFCWVKV